MDLTARPDTRRASRARRASQRLAYGILVHMAPPTMITGWSGASLIYLRTTQRRCALCTRLTRILRSTEPEGHAKASIKGARRDIYRICRDLRVLVPGG